MQLEIITAEKKVFEGEVTEITLPGVDGSFQLLSHHAPLMSLLKEGVVKYKSKEVKAHVHITGGVVEVAQNKVIVLADATR